MVEGEGSIPAGFECLLTRRRRGAIKEGAADRQMGGGRIARQAAFHTAVSAIAYGAAQPTGSDRGVTSKATASTMTNLSERNSDRAACHGDSRTVLNVVI